MEIKAPGAGRNYLEFRRGSDGKVISGVQTGAARFPSGDEYELEAQLGLKDGRVVIKGGSPTRLPKSYSQILRRIILAQGRILAWAEAFELQNYRQVEPKTPQQQVSQARKCLNLGNRKYLQLMPTSNDPPGVSWNPEQTDVTYRILVEQEAREASAQQPSGDRRGSEDVQLTVAKVVVALRGDSYLPDRELALLAFEVAAQENVSFGGCELIVAGRTYHLALVNAQDFYHMGLPPHGRILEPDTDLSVQGPGRVKAVCMGFSVPVEVARAAVRPVGSQGGRVTDCEVVWYPMTATNPRDRGEQTAAYLSWPAETTKRLGA